MNWFEIASYIMSARGLGRTLLGSSGTHRNIDTGEKCRARIGIPNAFLGGKGWQCVNDNVIPL